MRDAAFVVDALCWADEGVRRRGVEDFKRGRHRGGRERKEEEKLFTEEAP